MEGLKRCPAEQPVPYARANGLFPLAYRNQPVPRAASHLPSAASLARLLNLSLDPERAGRLKTAPFRRTFGGGRLARSPKAAVITHPGPRTSLNAKRGPVPTRFFP